MPQFRYINDQAKDHQAAGDPVISVDAKKKENVGQFRQAGRTWRPRGQPEKVKVHDFIGKDKGKVTPYGVYDIGANSGWVGVGTDHDTAAFAVSTIRTWWEKAGRDACPGASRLLVTADGGGSSGYRIRLWKTELARLASETGLAVTVVHFPPGTQCRCLWSANYRFRERAVAGACCGVCIRGSGHLVTCGWVCSLSG